MGEYRYAQVTQNATPQVPLIEAIDDAMTVHPSWEKVGVFRQGPTSGWTDHIYRCLGTGNDWGQDWYFWLIQPTNSDGSPVTSGSYINYLYYQVSEIAESHATIAGAMAMRGYPGPSSYNASYTPTTNGWYSTNQVGSMSAPDGHRLTVNATNYNYRLLVTRNCVHIKSSVGSSNETQMSVGLYEPFWNHPDEFPLQLTFWGGDNYRTGGAVTRRPGATTSTVVAFATERRDYTPRMGGIGEAAVLYRPPVGSRPMLIHYNGQGGTTGAERGLMYDVLRFNYASGVGVTTGDTFTSPSGDQYEHFGSYVFVNKSAP